MTDVPTSKAASKKWLWLLLGLGSVGGCCCLGIVASAATGRGEARATARPASSAAPDLPWLADVASNCAAYSAAPNDIKKSSVFRENEMLLSRTSVNNAQGRLETLRTNQGGSELSLRIKVGNASFATESLFAPIKEGSAVYRAASDMKVGQCVRFSAGPIKAASLSERAMVCDFDYFATFTSVAPCD